MNERIKLSDLERLVEKINKVSGNPTEPYTDGRANFGNYHLSGAYGGWKLEQMLKDGATTDVLGSGYCSKRALYGAMRGYYLGLVMSEPVPCPKCEPDDEQE